MRKRPFDNSRYRQPDYPLPSWLRNRWLGLAFLVAVLAASQWLKQRPGQENPVPEGEIAGVPRLVDGDSFHMGGEEIRLVGIDAPEGRQTCTRTGVSWPCGEDSRRTLARLIGNRSISCKSRERDQHGRLLAVCFAGPKDINREMVASGMALAYGNYEREEQDARRAKRGLWSGEFERPRQWRSQHGAGRG